MEKYNPDSKVVLNGFSARFYSTILNIAGFDLNKVKVKY